MECYSSKCYDCTHNNILKVKNMESIEEVLNFNYKDTYPDKLIFIDDNSDNDK